MTEETNGGVIDDFRGKYSFLSNFHSVKVSYNGITYLNNEAAFQAQKDLSRCADFATLSSSDSKKLGRKVNLRADWEYVKDGIMRDVVLNKFTQNPELAEKLIATGDAELIEGNTWGDRYWGVVRGDGLNLLGKILMETRSKLVENLSGVASFDNIVKVGYAANTPNGKIQWRQPWLAQRTPELLAIFGCFGSHGVTTMYRKNDSSNEWEFVIFPVANSNDIGQAIDDADHLQDLISFFDSAKESFGVAGIAVTNSAGIIETVRKG